MFPQFLNTQGGVSVINLQSSTVQTGLVINPQSFADGGTGVRVILPLARKT